MIDTIIPSTPRSAARAVTADELAAADAVALETPYLFGRRQPDTTRAERGRRAVTMSAVVAHRFGPVMTHTMHSRPL